MSKLFCLQRDFLCENDFNFYELEATTGEEAQEEVEEGIATNNSQEWITEHPSWLNLKSLTYVFTYGKRNEDE